MDADLITRLRRGDRSSVEDLYRNAFNSCSKIVLNNSGDINDAKDLFQESIMVLFKNLRKEDFELTCDVKTYLYSIMRNLWLKQINNRKKGGHTVALEDYHSNFLVLGETEFTFEDHTNDRQNAVEKALQGIKEDCKKLLLKYYFSKIPLKEIAVQMEYTYQFIKVKKNRCMAKLKSEVALIQSN